MKKSPRPLKPGQPVWVRLLDGSICPARIKSAGFTSLVRYTITVYNPPQHLRAANPRFVIERGKLSVVNECRIVAGNPGTGRPLIPPEELYYD